MIVPPNPNLDPLCKCRTKDSLLPELNELIISRNGSHETFSLLLLDLDQFKLFNDKHGHLFGDEIIQYFSSSLHLHFKDHACALFRFGGDEFIVLFRRNDAKSVAAFTAELKKNMRLRPFLYHGRIFRVTFSAGVASYPTDSMASQDLIQKADEAMYCAKKMGRNRVVIYSAMKREHAKSAVLIFLVLAFLFSVLYLFKNNFSHLYSQVKKTTHNIKVASQIDRKNAVIYLKSDPLPISGEIVYENEKIVEVRLSLKKGQGTLVINKDEILRIEKPSAS